MTRLRLFIAFRYLFAKKSHNVINIISAISCVGMAIGTAALIIILSVYNGLDSVVREGISVTEPDLLAKPQRGKSVIFPKEGLDNIAKTEGVKSVNPYISDNVFADYNGAQSLAIVKGVEDRYFEDVPMSGFVVEGKTSLHKGSLPQAVVGRGLASSLRLSPRFVAGLNLYYPSEDISIANPLSSLRSAKVFPSATVSVNQEFDSKYIIAPIEDIRGLTGFRENEYSGIEIRLFSEETAHKVRKDLENVLGDNIVIRTKEEQNEALYKMLRGEKAMIFLILTFIIIVIAFNIFGSLSMLIMEKKDDIRTLMAMGMSPDNIRKTFIAEGWLISIMGVLPGAVAGILLSLAQQHYGFIKMPGNFIIDAYPVVLQWTDVLFSIATVGLIGYIIAMLPARKIKNFKIS